MKYTNCWSKKTLWERGKYRKISIIKIHAPTEDKGIEKKERYYEDLETVLQTIPKYDIKIITGDCNAKLGKKQKY